MSKRKREQQLAIIAAADRTLWQETWRRFRKSPTAMTGLVILCLLILMALATIVIDLVTGNAVYEKYVIGQDLTLRFAPPSLEHPFGCDELGRDMFFRVIWGIRYSIFLGAAAVAIAAVVGCLLGAVSGYYGRTVDNVIMRVMDILLATPQMLLAIAIVAALGTSITNLLIAISISYVPTYARLIRASVMTVKDQEFVEAVRALGAGDRRIILRHIFPNAMAPAIVQASLGVAYAILALASMSFIGLGIQPPAPEWGSMLSGVRNYIRESWHLTVVPGACIMLTILALNLVGDGLRDAFDPRLKK